jgi:hypothetical protein
VVERRIAKAAYGKAVVTMILVFIGASSGVYIGTRWAADANRMRDEPAQLLTDPAGIIDSMAVSFTAGDLFPLVDYSTHDGDSGNFEDLLKGKKSLIMFVTLGCDPCHELLQLMQVELVDRALPGVQFIVCLADSPNGIPPEYKGLFSGMHVLICDAHYWSEVYDMHVFPSIVAVDRSGFVTHVQFGFLGFLDYQLTRHFFGRGEFTVK